MTGPVRIQLRRTKGWRMPENTVSVARPGRCGNPFTISVAIESEFATAATAPGFVVECFRDWLGESPRGRGWWQGPESDARKATILAEVPKLRGKNLACWCAPGQPCHADVLLEMANREPVPTGIYYSREHGNFYSIADRHGMGMAFWTTWRKRWEDFPDDPHLSGGSVVHGNIDRSEG